MDEIKWVEDLPTKRPGGPGSMALWLDRLKARPGVWAQYPKTLNPWTAKRVHPGFEFTTRGSRVARAYFTSPT